jgi:hypothetical protein
MCALPAATLTDGCVDFIDDACFHELLAGGRRDPGRINPLGDVPYTESDLENTPAPRLSLGADFFMNTLNNIHSLIDVDTSEAEPSATCSFDLIPSFTTYPFILITISLLSLWNMDILL